MSGVFPWVILLLVTNGATLALLAALLRRQRVRTRTMARQYRQMKYELLYDRERAEIISLQSQINPHFLYNTLEGIRSEALINGDEAAATMTEALANYFRYNISNKKDIVTVGEELDNIDNYIKIQQRRFGSKIAYEIEYDTGREEVREARIPKLTLQPLVENAIYHGLEKKADKGTVRVYAVTTQDRIVLRVTDDGPGMSRATLEEVEQNIEGMPADGTSRECHGGIALANVHRRIRMLYGNAYGLTISSALGVGTQAEVTLPRSSDASGDGWDEMISHLRWLEDEEPPQWRQHK